MSRHDADQGQPSTRRQAIIYDQHESTQYPKGRPYNAMIDKRSGFPVGVIQPRGWRAPWMPDQTAFVFSEEEPTKFRINYEGILESRLKAHEEWAATYKTTALRHGWDPEDSEKQNSLMELVGAKPLPIEPIVAAMQGNRWILGLTNKADPRLEAFIPKRATRVERFLSKLPDFSDSPDDDESDDILDLEEAHDPGATGGKTMTPGQLRAQRMRDAKALRKAAQAA